MVALQGDAVCLAAGAVRALNTLNDGISSPVGSPEPRIVTEGIQTYFQKSVIWQCEGTSEKLLQ